MCKTTAVAIFSRTSPHYFTLAVEIGGSNSDGYGANKRGNHFELHGVRQASSTETHDMYKYPAALLP